MNLTLREEHRPRVCENRVLRRDEVKEVWRELLNEKFHDLYSSPSIIRMIELRRMKWVGYVARIGEKWNAY
jgi:hypothetical protein